MPFPDWGAGEDDARRRPARRRVAAEAVKMQRCADVVAMLALLCEVPMPLVQSLLQKEHREAVLIPCKAAALSWRTVRTMLASRTIGRPLSEMAPPRYLKRRRQVRQADEQDGPRTTPISAPLWLPRRAAYRHRRCKTLKVAN